MVDDDELSDWIHHHAPEPTPEHPELTPDQIREYEALHAQHLAEEAELLTDEGHERQRCRELEKLCTPRSVLSILQATEPRTDSINPTGISSLTYGWFVAAAGALVDTEHENAEFSDDGAHVVGFWRLTAPDDAEPVLLPEYFDTLTMVFSLIEARRGHAERSDAILRAAALLRDRTRHTTNRTFQRPDYETVFDAIERVKTPPAQPDISGVSSPTPELPGKSDLEDRAGSGCDVETEKKIAEVVSRVKGHGKHGKNWNGPDASRPDAFEFGPIEGTAKEIAKWCRPKSKQAGKSTRPLNALFESGLIWGQEIAGSHHVWFSSEPAYLKAVANCRNENATVS